MTLAGDLRVRAREHGWVVLHGITLTHEPVVGVDLWLLARGCWLLVLAERPGLPADHQQALDGIPGVLYLTVRDDVDVPALLADPVTCLEGRAG